MRRVAAFLLSLLCVACFIIVSIEGSALSNALSAALTEVVGDGSKYADCYKPFGLDATPPDITGCPNFPSEPSGALQSVLERKKIRFGVSPFEPSAFLKDDGKIIDGTEVRLGVEIVDKLGDHYDVDLEVEWVWVTEMTDFFGKLKNGLDEHKYDAVLSSVTLTPSRASLVDFTCPYFTTYQGLLRGPREANRTFNSVPSDLNNPSVLIGHLGGTTGQAWVTATLPLATKKIYVNETVLVNAVKNGEVHFGVSDKAILAYGLKVQHPPCPSCSLLDGNYGSGDHYAIFTTKEATPSPSPSPSPTPRPTPRPKPDPKELKSGTMFSLFTIGFFGAIVLAGVVVGMYVQLKRGQWEHLGV